VEIQASENLDMARFEALGVIKNDAVFDQFKLEFFSETIAVPVGILVRGVGDESFFFVMMILFARCMPLFAYIDPGTGSYIFQVLIAGLISIPFIIKAQGNRIKIFIIKLINKSKM
jgi:hypothetical protein